MNDVLAQLAAANPVHVDDLGPLTFSESFEGRRPATRRAWAVALIATAVVAAALIGVFAFGDGSRSIQPREGIQGVTGAKGPGPLGVAGPIGGPLTTGKKVGLPEAAGVLGVPLVLPDTALIGPGDVGPVWADSQGPTMGIVAVTYPAQGLLVEYIHPPSLADEEGYYREAAKGPGMQLIDLNGTPALVFTPTPDHAGDENGSISFTFAGTEFRISGHQDEPTLEAIARSILDRQRLAPGTPGIIAPALEPVNLTALSDTFGSPVVLPRTPLVKPSDALSAWVDNDCTKYCSVRVYFPAHGLAVTYYRPPGQPDSRAGFEEVAANVRFGDAQVIDLGGVPALVIENQDADGLGSIAFLWHGTRVEVDAFENAAVLTDLAKSMLDQLRGTSSGPFTATPGMNLFPIVAPEEQIPVSDASDTLGQPVVLPDTPAVQPSDAASAWAKGQCPHASTSSSDGHSGCAVWVKFPSKGLTIVYERPGGIGPGVDPRQLSQMTGAHLVDLNGVSALAVDRNAESPGPGWLGFAIGGTRVYISGDFATSTLEAIGQSIVDRSR